MKQEEINSTLSEEFKLPEEHINLIVNHFWKGLRYFVVNPTIAKGSILINGLFALNIPVIKIERYLENVENKTYKRASIQKRSVDYYTNLKELIKSNERKTNRQD